MNPFFLPFFDAPMLDWGNLKKNRRKTNNIHTPRLIGVLPLAFSLKKKRLFLPKKQPLFFEKTQCTLTPSCADARQERTHIQVRYDVRQLPV
jgi:hypothetical protein